GVLKVIDAGPAGVAGQLAAVVLLVAVGVEVGRDAIFGKEPLACLALAIAVDVKVQLSGNRRKETPAFQEFDRISAHFKTLRHGPRPFLACVAARTRREPGIYTHLTAPR